MNVRKKALLPAPTCGHSFLTPSRYICRSLFSDVLVVWNRGNHRKAVSYECSQFPATSVSVWSGNGCCLCVPLSFTVVPPSSATIGRSYCCAHAKPLNSDFARGGSASEHAVRSRWISRKPIFFFFLSLSQHLTDSWWFLSLFFQVHERTSRRLSCCYWRSPHWRDWLCLKSLCFSESRYADWLRLLTTCSADFAFIYPSLVSRVWTPQAEICKRCYRIQWGIRHKTDQPATR